MCTILRIPLQKLATKNKNISVRYSSFLNLIPPQTRYTYPHFLLLGAGYPNNPRFHQCLPRVKKQ